MTEAVAALEQITKRYPLGKTTVTAVDAVSVDILPERFTVLSGPSGSGKTTLLNLLGCIDKPDQGRLVFGEQDMSRLKDRALTDFRAGHIGFVFQNFNLIPVLSVYENVEYPLLIQRVAHPERRHRVGEVLESVGLGDQAAKYPNQLSGGQQQRVAIARALVKQPRLVLADEPTANLDSATGRTIIDLMRKLQIESRASVVFSSHDPRILAEADDAILLRDGRIDDHRCRN